MLNYNGLYKPEWIILKCFISLIYFFIIIEKFYLNEDEVLKRLSIGEMWRICGGTSDGQQTKDCPRVSDSICIELPPLAICYTCTIPQDSLKCNTQALCNCPEWGQYDCECPPKNSCIPFDFLC